MSDLRAEDIREAAEVREFRQWVAAATDEAIAGFLARDLERIERLAEQRRGIDYEAAAKMLSYKLEYEGKDWHDFFEYDWLDQGEYRVRWREIARAVVGAALGTQK